jgi:phosphopantetheine--protein transferase-like protein
MGIGIDIVSVGRFRREEGSPNRFLSRTFTRREVAYCKSKADPPVHFAGTFAAKEAAFKAVRVLHKGRLDITDFEVSHRSDGLPEVTYVGADAALGNVVVSVSVSHSKEDAVAVALSFMRG